MNANLSAALAYAESGFDPLPLEGKKPLQRRWQVRRLDQPRAIRKSWEKWPAANVGLRTGGDLIVIDVDLRNGGEASLERLCDGRTLPETATARTGGGGWHFCFKPPSGSSIGCRQNLMGLTGLDVKGQGGQVVVEPSIHPDTGREYVWTRTLRSGVADLPDWLLRMLVADGRVGPTDRGIVPLSGTIRVGGVDRLSADLIRRFPVPRPRHRNDLMVKCIASLVGRGYDDDTTIRAVSAWWFHFHDLGKVWTSPSEAPHEIRKTIGILRSSNRFGRAIGDTNHREACRSIVLNKTQIEKLNGENPGQPRANTKRVTLTRGRLCDGLCVSVDDLAFVEALVVHSTHKLATEHDGLIRMTHDQVRAIAADRNPATGWDNKQFARLKEKYIARPGKPATRFEMLVEVEKGDRKPGQAIGTPSVYRPTGILEFLRQVEPMQNGMFDYYCPHYAPIAHGR